MDKQKLNTYSSYLPGKQNDFLMHLFIGGSDGIVLMVFITTLLASTGISSTSRLNISLVIMLLVGLIMGISGYIASLIEKKHFKTVQEEAAQLEEIRKETVLLDNLEINKNLQLIAFKEMEKDRQHWARLMGETRLENPGNSSQSFMNGTKTGLSYVLGGLLPLLPYLFSVNETALRSSFIISMSGLVIFGYFKSFYKNTKPLISVLSSMGAGILAGSGAYAISKIFMPLIYTLPVFY